VKIRPIKSQDELEQVYCLTHDLYVVEGYCKPKPDRRLIHYPHLDGIQETTVFVAVEDGKVIGSNSLTVDGPHGLHVDMDDEYRDKVKQIRDECRANAWNLGSSWRIVVSSLSHNVKAVLGLIGITVEHIYMHKLHRVLYNFHPRHARFYNLILGLETLAEGTCGADGLSHPPSVLMVSDYARLHKHWSKICKHHDMILEAHQEIEKCECWPYRTEMK
jgi:hypothetical protein